MMSTRSSTRNKVHSSPFNGPPTLPCGATQSKAIASAVAACCAGKTDAAGATAICGVGLTMLLALSGPVLAATFSVTNTDDSGPGSLRQAVVDANANPGPDDIQFSSVSGDITLSSGAIVVTDPLYIQGPGADTLRVSGTNVSEIFRMIDGAAYQSEISGLTLSNAYPAAIVSFGSNFRIVDSVVSGNTGHGIQADYGGESGYELRTYLEIENSTIADNGGFGIDIYDSDVLVVGSTISGNRGGGINGNTAFPFYYFQRGTDLEIVNTTISGNLGTGGVNTYKYETTRAVLLVRNSTVVGNTGDTCGGIETDGQANSVRISNSIVAGNVATNGDPDLCGEYRVAYSLIEDPGTATIQEPVPGSNLVGQDPQLGPLQDNGGPTRTHALSSGSPAVDAGDPGFSPPPDSDQRGQPRVVDGHVDMGAYELQGTGRIGDFVWDDIDGDGVQDAGEPGIEGATVRLRDCAGNQQMSMTTDEDGIFDFTGLAAGSYQVQFQAPAGFDFSPPLQGAKRGRDSNADPATGMSACLSMPAGKVRLGIDAGLVRHSGGSGRIGDFVWEDLNRDGIQDAGEPGFEGATVRLLDCAGAVVASTTSGPNGEYRFDALVAGDYQVGFVAPPGFAFSPPEQGNRRGRDSNADPSTGLSACLSMPQGKIRRGIDAGLVATGSGEIGDFVWDDMDGDGIQDAGEPGFEGTTVRLQDCTGEVFASTTTDDQGAYRFRALPVGNYKVEFVTPDGYVLSPRAQGNRRGRDSDPFSDSGLTQCLAMPEGKVRLGIDAGMVFDPVD